MTMTRIGRSMTRTATLIPALGLLLAACGDDGGGGAPDGTDDAGDILLEAGDVTDVDAAGCIDLDFDLHGIGCPAGLDCDDTDPAHFEDCEECLSSYPPAGCGCPFAGLTEACYDGPPGTAGVGRCQVGTRLCDTTRHLVADCVGQVLPADEEICGDGVDNNCNRIGDEEAAGPCGDCDTTCRTSGDIEPAPGDIGSWGLDESPGGVGVVLGVDDVEAAFVWVPNTAEGSVSKLDIETGAEVARYRVGQTGSANDAPSRTAVDGIGNVFVATMANVSATMNQGAVTKIAGDRGHCIDRNRSGFIETSTGSTRLPLGSDECVLWTAPVCDPGGVPRAVAVTGEAGGPGTPWVGCFNEMTVHRLDPATGAVVSTIDLEVNPFGAARAPDGWIWISGRAPAPGYLQRFHAPSEGLDPRVGVPGECDPYGIATDSTGRVWIGGTGGHVCRYDPAAETWGVYPVPRGNAPGVAVDPDGNAWAITFDGAGVALAMFPADDVSPMVTYNIPGASPYGIAADEFGYVWTVNQGSDSVTRFTRATAETAGFGAGRAPLAYTDFTGIRRTIVATTGLWVQDFQRCDTTPSDRWGRLTWEVDTPASSAVDITARSAAVPEDLATAPAVVLATIPPSASYVDIESAFSTAGVAAAAHLRLEITLTAGSAGESPVVRTVEVRWHCGE